MSKNIGYLSGRKGLDDNLFEALGRSADEHGTVPAAEMKRLAEKFLMGDANVYSSVTFYDFLRPENQGKKIYVCNGSACLTAGTQDALTQKLSEHFPADEIGQMCCLGRCHENHAFHYAGNNYSGKAIEQITAIQSDKKARPDAYRAIAHGTPVLTSEYPGLATFYLLLKDSLKKSPDALLAELKTSGLRGRGGAGFPTAFKFESCKNTPGEVKFLVCNADEGDPGAYSDRYIMEERPHSLLLGMLLAGYIIGAEHGVLYIRGEYPESIRATRDAIAEIRQAGYLGNNILDSGFSFDFKIIEAQGAYICGEETALLSSIEGQRPEVRVRPPLPYPARTFQPAHSSEQRGNASRHTLHPPTRRRDLRRHWPRPLHRHQTRVSRRALQPARPVRGGHGYAFNDGRTRTRRRLPPPSESHAHRRPARRPRAGTQN